MANRDRKKPTTASRIPARTIRTVILQRMPGASFMSVGPGRKPSRNSAAINTEVVALPGMPSAKLGIKAPTVDALLAISAAMTPAGSPFPNFSGCLAPFFARS